MDEQLRMQAVVVDGFTGPLRRLRGEMQSVSRLPTLKAMQQDWRGIEQSVGRVTRELGTGLSPVLSGIGLASLSIGAALGAAAIGIKNFAGDTRALSLMSKELGISTQALREFKALAEFFKMPWDEARGSLETFGKSIDSLHRRTEVYGKLLGLNLGSLAEAIRSAPNFKEALDRTLEGIKAIPNPVRQREVAAALLGSEHWATIAREMTPKVVDEIKKSIGELPAGSESAAEQFEMHMLRISNALEKLRVEGFGALLPQVDRFLGTLVGADQKLGPILKFTKDMSDGLKQINDVVEGINEGKWSKVFGSIFTLTPGGLAERILDPAASKRQSDMSVLETEIGRRETRRGMMDETLARGRGDETLRMKRDKLVEEIEKLRKALEDLRNAPTVQKQSFDAGGFGGARILPASLRGTALPQLFDRGGGGGGGAIRVPGGLGGGTGAAPPMGNVDPYAFMPGRGGGAGFGPLAGAGGTYRPPYALGDADLSNHVVNTIAGEAYTNNRRSVDAVINNMLNRVGTRTYGPSGNLEQVARAPGQYAGYRSANAKEAEFIRSRIKAIASGGEPDITGGSNEYRAGWYSGPWGRKHADSPVIGGNRFAYNPRGGRGPYGPYAEPRNDRDMSSVGRSLVGDGSRSPLGGALGDSMMSRAFNTGVVGGGAQKVEGSATIDINLNGFPAGARTRSVTDGMVRELNFSQDRQISGADDRL